VTLYNDASVAYDAADVLYDGIALRDPLTLVIDGFDETGTLATQSLSVTAGTHGNSLGTLDAKLNDPPAVPEAEQAVDLYVGEVRRFRGTVRAVEAQEFIGGYVFAKIGAQDEGPDSVLPTAAPFGLSDDPDDVTTKGYRSLMKMTRTTEGGSPKTTYRAVVRHVGLWAGMNVEVTSATYGLAAEELAVVEVTASFPGPTHPQEYALTLGEPLVKLAQVMSEHPPADGLITETMIADDSISTPKLQANSVETGNLAADAVIANVANVGDTVVIDDTGITVTDGAITVENGDLVVIIDGTSNMFKIAATGTLTVSGVGGGVATTVLSALGAQAATPAHLGFVTSGVDPTAAYREVGIQIDNAILYAASSSGGSPTFQFYGINAYTQLDMGLDGSSFARARLVCLSAYAFSVTRYGRYYVLKEASI
jgi:hypothetical protein